MLQNVITNQTLGWKNISEIILENKIMKKITHILPKQTIFTYSPITIILVPDNNLTI